MSDRRKEVFEAHLQKQYSYGYLIEGFKRRQASECLLLPSAQTSI